MAFNMSGAATMPPLPSYTLSPMPALVPPIPDKYLTLVLPIIAYWALSMVFHYIDEYDLFPQYRLHTPAEVLKRNHVSRYEVVRDVVVQQIIQTAVGVVLAYPEADQMIGKDDYNVAVWGQRIRAAQRFVPRALAVLGINSAELGGRFLASNPQLAGFLAGGQYPWLVTMTAGVPVPAFAHWETLLARFVYWVGVPMLQFALAIMIVDTWQYFLHRGMHQNKWLYTTFHARHHRLYVPYAYGALYNHPFEGFLLDTCGTGIAYLVAGLTPRQSMWFFTGSTCKTVDDHCGYALPWDPLQHLTSNNAGYHDVHHQSWGIKTNFSQPFFTFWDRFLGTVWTGGDVSARYERARLAAQKKLDADSVTGSNSEDSVKQSIEPYDQETGGMPRRPSIPFGKASLQAIASQQQVLESSASGSDVLRREEEEERREEQRLRRSPRKKSPVAQTTVSSQSTGLRGLKNRVSVHSPAGSLVDTGR